MKNTSLIILFFASIFCYAQSDESHGSTNQVFNVVEQMPQFPGGEEALMKFIQKNIQYPNVERAADIQGRVVMSLIINEDGSLSDITVKKGVTKGLDNEALRVIRLLPKFKPGKQQGKPVKVSYVLPIMFRLSEPAPKELRDPRKRN